MVGQLSSLVGDEVGTHMYVLLNRVQMWRICSVFFSGSLPPVYVLPDRVLANPRATARVPTAPLHRPRPYYDHDSCENMVQLWRVCTVFFSLRFLAGEGSPGGRKGDMVQLWRVCTIFFDAFRLFICYTRQRVLWLLIADKQSPGHD
jgi:hypothetical protein